MSHVFITGLSVLVQKNNDYWYGPTPHWNILELFYQNMLAYSFGAVQTYPGIGRSTCDRRLNDSLKILTLNRGPYTEIGRIKESPYLYSRLMRYIASTDYVYVRLPSWVGLSALHCAYMLGKPFFLSLHGDWEVILRMYENNAKNAHSRLYYKIMQRYVRKSLNNYINKSEISFFVGNNLRNKFLHVGPSSVAYHDSTHLAEDVWSTRDICKNDKTTLLFVGEISKAKGVDVLINAIKNLSQNGRTFRLIFVGQGPEYQNIKSLTIPNVSIEMKGWVAQGASLDKLFLESDALVLPSLTEGVPRVIIEAMVRATPVIATRVGDISEMLGEGARGWLLPPSDSSALAEAIDNFITRKSEREAKVEASIEYVKKYDKFYWSALISHNLRNTIII